MKKIVFLFWLFWVAMSVVSGTAPFLAMLTAHILVLVWLNLPNPNFITLVVGQQILEMIPFGPHTAENQPRVDEIRDGVRGEERKVWRLVVLHNVVMLLAVLAVGLSMSLTFIASLPR